MCCRYIAKSIISVAKFFFVEKLQNRYKRFSLAAVRMLEVELHSRPSLHHIYSCLFSCSCVCVRVGGLLYSQVLHRPIPEQKQQLALHSKHVAACVTELVQAAEAMKGEATHTLSHILTQRSQTKDNL